MYELLTNALPGIKIRSINGIVGYAGVLATVIVSGNEKVIGIEKSVLGVKWANYLHRSSEEVQVVIKCG